MKEGCNLCQHMIEKEEIIYQTENFYVTPSLGQFVGGYLLICSKSHFIGLSYLPERLFKELEKLKEDVREILHETYNKKTLFFEHGPVSENKKGGCCIDHTHLHAIPFEKDILKDISKNFKPQEIRGLKELTKQKEKQIPYFYYENQEGKRFLFEINFPVPSQYLRQIIASKTSTPNKWDWRIYPEIKRFNETLRKLKWKKKNLTKISE